MTVGEALHRRAAEHGATLGEAATAGDGRPATPTAALDLAVRTLAEHGYEPRRDGASAVLANCPFLALAEAQRDLVCGMNHALVTGVVEGIAPGTVSARLEPAPGRCCVTLAVGS
ncbi:hypothetical protein [Xylanimonas sp. McL0601]|uniref:hypothetical protein n=1 Tax=Xylanimonas sp. McL0601 TaxID=3414739 RepID=UPI003CFA15D6